MTNNPSAEKPTDQWVTGDEPMTGPQRSYLETLAREAGEDVPQDLTKADASEAIERLQRITGRGADPGAPSDDPKWASADDPTASDPTPDPTPGATAGATAAGDDPTYHETLAERVDREGSVDPQESVVADQEAG